MFFDGFMLWLLNSPFHWPVSRKLMILTVTGRRTGKTYRLPVEYFKEGSTLTLLSRRERTWWKNLRGGARVTVRLRGYDLTGYGTVLEDSPETRRKAIEKVYGFLPRRLRNTIPADAVVVQISLQPAARHVRIKQRVPDQ